MVLNAFTYGYIHACRKRISGPVILKFLMIMLISFGIIQHVFSQTPILDLEVRLPEKTTTVRTILNELSSAGGFSFSYGKDVPLNKEVKLSPEKESIRWHLNHIFSGDSLQFIEKGNKILIVPAKTQQKKAKPKQTIKGRVLDLDSKTPLVGVNILLSSDAPYVGTISDENGYFKIDNVPVGRHDLKFSSIGYEPRFISNIEIGSGKEFVVAVEMLEAVVSLSEVEIRYQPKRSEPINDLAVISGRSFSSYEIENYPGSLSDISRTALSFPGVISPNDGQNHIVIRGNSPKGLQWRLEGIEIPNLNHFSEIGSSGGGVSVISNNMIAGSDFLTSAFPAEYGNALSGVFDLRLRNGNNEKHEQTFQVGLLGTELMVEGPLNKASNTTYIAQYRYSTLKLAQNLGVKLESVPDFQDLSFKIYHPSRRMGVFSFFGIGGLSHEEGSNGYIWNTKMATLGISNGLSLNPKTFIKSVISFSGWGYTWDQESNMGTSESPINRIWKTDVADITAKASLSINRKINAKHKIKAGVIYEMAFNDSYMAWHSDTLFSWYSNPENPNYLTQNYDHTYVDANLRAGTFQTFLNWKYRINEALTMNVGGHYLKFFLNNNYAIEPRFSLQWKAGPRHIFSTGFGIHSRKESLTLYAGRLTLHDGEVIQPNMDLELTKARHYVLGYNFLISESLNLKTEIYYQSLYDIPASPFPPYFSTINFDYGFEGSILDNYGTAYNTGIEMTLEKTNSKGYFFLVNGTLYESKFRKKTGEILHTKYDGTYAANGLFGKEFRVGREKQNILSISARGLLAGGMRYLPVDRERSIAEGYPVRIWDDGFTEKAADFMRFDLKIRFIRNRPNFTSEWSLDIMNLFNRKNMLYAYWDSGIQDFKKEYQNPIIPILNYRIQF